MRILAVGAGAKEFTINLMEGMAEVVIDTTDLKPSKSQTGYDALILFNCLNRVSYREITKVMKLWMDALRPGGEMTIFMPSLEWAAEQILFSESPSPALQAHLFGLQRNQKETFLGGYTLMQIRGFCDQVGLKITHAKTGIYEIAGHEADNHLIRGVKGKPSTGGVAG